ncbi:hypothetical protein J2T14_000650 [Paenibacillus harenae]|nr:hypothetical protein [Paenibacillus harenae]
MGYPTYAEAIVWNGWSGREREAGKTPEENFQLL